LQQIFLLLSAGFNFLLDSIPLFHAAPSTMLRAGSHFLCLYCYRFSRELETVASNVSCWQHQWQAGSFFSG